MQGRTRRYILSVKWLRVLVLFLRISGLYKSHDLEGWLWRQVNRHFLCWEIDVAPSSSLISSDLALSHIKVSLVNIIIYFVSDTNDFMRERHGKELSEVRFPWRRLCSSFGGARGVMVIVVGNEHGDTSSNPGRDWFHFT